MSWDGIFYDKYKIAHTDGTPLKGKRYFVLRLDSDDPVEAARVRAAMLAYEKKPRNCDIWTAENQGERFKNFCRNHQFISVDSEDGFSPMYVCNNESCPLHDYYIAHGEDNCELAWAQMPYKEGEDNGNQS